MTPLAATLQPLELTTPVGLLSYARRFSNAANQLETRTDALPAHYPVSHYLLGHALELAYKAFLLGCSVSETRLASREFGHDLLKLKREATRRRIARHARLTPGQHRAVRALAIEYRSKGLEYHRVGAKSMPRLLPLFEATDTFLSRLAPFCTSRTVGRRFLGRRKT